MIKPDYSYGTSGIINGLLLSENKRYSWNTFFINIITIIRNCYTKNVSLNALLDKMIIDIESINFYVNIYTDNKYKVNIIYYWPTYDRCLDRKIIRKKSTMNKNIFILYEKIYNEFYKFYIGNKANHHPLFDMLSLKSQTKDISTVITTPNKIPPIYLFNKFKFIWKIKPVLISHIGIDYHLKNFFNNLIILLSFSGRLLITNTDIASKMFNIETIRFNKYSHFLFGDNILIASNISRSKKKELKEISKKENWISLTNIALFKKLVNGGFLDKKSFKLNIY